MSDPTRPTRLRFSLRTLFVMVTLVCVWIGWQVNWIRQRHEAIKSSIALSFGGDTPAPWSIRLLDRGYPMIGVRSSEIAKDKAIVNRLKQLFPEATVYLVPDDILAPHPQTFSMDEL